MQGEMFSNYPDVLSAKQVCEMLPLGEVSIYRLLQSGKIRSLRKGTKYLVPKKCVIEYIEDNLK